MSTGALDTPPSSDIEASANANLPPSPPLSPPKRASRSAVDRLIGTLQLHRRGRLENHGDWLAFPLSQTEYWLFEVRLRKEAALLGWYQDKVRYDWDSQEGRLVLRMPTALHERFTVCVEKAIRGAIDDLTLKLEESGDAEDARIAVELRKIYEGRSTTLELMVPKLERSSQESGESDAGEQVVRRSPDATFYHPSQPDYPALVVEVSYSQQQKDLPRLAESYVIDSSHAICAVVGFKIPYLPPGNQDGQKLQASARPDRSANYSLWRPGLEYMGQEADDGARETIGVCSQIEREVHLRHPDGSRGDTMLRLQLSDLLPSTLPIFATMRTPKKSMPILVHLDELVELLVEVKAAERASKVAATDKAATEATSRTPKTFRKRKRTPSEELSDGREETFLRQEMRERVKDAAVDGEYVERPRRSTRRKVGQGEKGAEAVQEVAVRGGDDTVVGASRDVG